MATAKDEESTLKKKKPCRVCVDFKTWTKTQGGKHTSASSSEKKDRLSDVKTQSECPVDSEEMGRATWTYLHTMAAYYPDSPTTDEQKNMKKFLNIFSRFYPCDYCAEHMREWLKTNPPKTENRVLFSNWMCDMHNDVNKRIGKKLFDCSKVDERWLDGWKDGSCD